MTAPIAGTGPEGALAGEVFGGGAATAPVLGGVAGETLPFTGSFFTIPIAVFGLALTLGGWLVHRLAREPEAE